MDTFPNIKFAINIHTHGGYFMWAPGAYKVPGRITLPAPNIGIERYFFDVADRILSRIEESRDTVIVPSRTGPIADVLYSAAGNSADDQYYRKGIVAYSFEAGAQRFSTNASGQTVVTDVGFFPNFASEGRFEALEFADGNYGLLEGALEYARDDAPPVVNLEYSAEHATAPPINYRFTWPGEAAVIHYTTDGSTPTTASPTYENQGPRRPGQVLQLDRIGFHTIKWIAVDIKGNTSAVQSKSFLIGPEADVSGTVPATLSLSVSNGSLGSFTPGVAPRVRDDDAGHRDLDGRRRRAVGDGSQHGRHRPPGQRVVRAAAAAAAQGPGRRVHAAVHRRRRVDAPELHGPGVQRRRDDRREAVDRPRPADLAGLSVA